MAGRNAAGYLPMCDRLRAPRSSGGDRDSTMEQQRPVHGSLTPEQIRLVRETWTQVVPLAYAFSGEFYERLFSLDPSIRPLFRRDMAEQRGKFIAMLSLIVRELSDPDRLQAEVGALGRRHLNYGVRAEHYATLESALLWTLERAVGPTFGPEARDAWSCAFASWATIMREAASGVTVPPSLPERS